jgi:hypothetical protein
VVKLLCWYIVYSLAFPFLLYVREIYPFHLHKVSEIRIFCAYFAWVHFHIALCFFHGGVVVFDFSIHWGCATSLFLLVTWSISGLVCCVFSGFLSFCRILFVFCPFVFFCPILPFYSGSLSYFLLGFYSSFCLLCFWGSVL